MQGAASTRAGVSKRGAAKRALLSRSLARMVVDHHAECLPMEDIARISGETLWTLRYHFRNPKGILRAVSLFLLGTIEDRLKYRDERSSTVLRALEEYAFFLGDLMRGRTYQDFISLVSRNHGSELWLKDIYSERILSKACRLAKATVAAAGDRCGAAIILPDAAAVRLFKEIERKRALVVLLPSPATAFDNDESDEFERQLARKIHAETYVMA
jgi:hypothetical protein